MNPDPLIWTFVPTGPLDGVTLKTGGGKTTTVEAAEWTNEPLLPVTVTV
jgi:hypothetical protein